MRLRWIAVALLASGCTGTIVPIKPGSDGLEAIRFKRTIQLPIPIANIYTFQAGTVFVHDREWAGGTMYCGAVPVGEIVDQLCLALKGETTLVVKPDKPLATEHRIEPGTIERFKLK
jgi:hypothetical protein